MLPHNFLEKMENSSSIVYIFVGQILRLESGKKHLKERKPQSGRVTVTMRWQWSQDKAIHILQPLKTSKAMGTSWELF